MTTIEKIAVAVVVILVVLSIGRIYSNSEHHKKYVKFFVAKCHMAGGEVYVPEGVKGRPMPICFSKGTIIYLGEKKDD